ncbi:MAG: hypothetical protein Q8O74_08315 [bacterium]|nr:hypothetical protein [bacterium]
MKSNKPQSLVLWFTLIPLIAGCASTIETKYTKKDHFMAGKYEVGAIEYERGKRGTFTLLWGFPIYLNGQKVKTIFCQTQATSEYQKNKEAQAQFDRGEKKALVRNNEWVLIEETTDGTVKELKQYKDKTTIFYNTVKQDIIQILMLEQ